MTRACIVVALALAALGCQRIPEDRYGIARLRFEGVRDMDARALSSCLATRERSREGIALGVPGTPSCGEPPFDARRVELRLWTWPWETWPLFDETLFARDLERVIRWYRARGYPNARVVETRITPESAEQSDIVDAETTCERDGEGRGCRVSITIVIEEGEPIHVVRVALDARDADEVLDARTLERLRRAIVLDEGDRFDEHDYERGKTALRELLAERGHCRASVEGRVRIRRASLEAEVDYTITPGPICYVGEIEVEGNADLPLGPILRASGLSRGRIYRPSDITDAQQAIFALGAFASVEVEGRATSDGTSVPITISVRPAQRNRFMLGGGTQTGLDASAIDVDGQVVSQWDLHLLGRWENRNLAGGMRRLALEDRVRLIWNEQFPRVERFEPDRNLGNIFKLELEQPAFIEARTSLRFTGLYDLGPDPYAGFFRHALRAAVDVERPFWRRRIRLSLGVHAAAYLLPDEPEDVTDPRQSWHVGFWQQLVELDLRDRPMRTRKGLYLALRLQEAGYGLPGSWRYVRILPEVRAYAPLGAGIVLAARARIGVIAGGDRFGDRLSEDNPLRLGPDIHRFRGGGPVSNRGFLAQRLGDGEAGGTRLWEASVELRVPINDNLFLAGFSDIGDVSRQARFRFDHLQLSLGVGVRYYTIVGPIRLDVGFRVPGAQVLGADERVLAYCRDPMSPGLVDCDGERYRGRLFGGPGGAIHLTIGDSF